MVFLQLQDARPCKDPQVDLGAAGDVASGGARKTDRYK